MTESPFSKLKKSMDWIWKLKINQKILMNGDYKDWQRARDCFQEAITQFQKVLLAWCEKEAEEMQFSHPPDSCKENSSFMGISLSKIEEMLK